MATTATIFLHPFWYGFGVFTGIVAGIIINIGIQWWGKKRRKEEIVQNIKFEINYNIEHIDSLIKKLDELRKAVSVDNPSLAPCYLNISHKIQAQTVMAYRNGLLYEIMPRKHIASLLKFSDDFSYDFQVLYNKDIHNIIHEFDKKQAGEKLKFIDTTFKRHRGNLQEALESLS